MMPDGKSSDPPIDPPIAPTKDPKNPGIPGDRWWLRESTPSPSEAPEVDHRPPPNNRVGSIGVARLSELVTARDLEILRSVEAHRLLLSRHIYELHFWNHASWGSGIRACNRVLNRLSDHRLIRRLKRPVGGPGGGSQSYVWALDVAGDRLLRSLSQDDRTRRRPFEPSTLFLNHTLAIADRRLELERAARQGALELVRVVTEPSNWRYFPGTHGAAISLKPDLEVTTAAGDWEDDWFLEQDLGTESGTALLRKCSVYDAYFKSGREQSKTGTFPRVVWLMPSHGRAEFLRRLIAQDRTLNADLFTVIESADLVACITAVDDAEPPTANPPPG